MNVKSGLLLLLLCACASRSIKKDLPVESRKPAGYELGEVFRAPQVDTSKNLTCDDFFALLKRYRPKTVSETLRLVRAKNEKYLGEHVLAFASRSLQDSNFDFPRVLVYGGDAKMIMTFNGRPDQLGYERIELMCFNDKSKTFEFRDVAFPADALNRDVLADIKPAQLKQPYVISPVGGVEGRACVQCHQQPARPNWDPYQSWPGFYGGADDSTTAPERRSSAPENEFYSKWEDAHLQKFLNGERKRGRYQFLPPNSEIRNANLGVLLSHLNAQRIIAELRRLGPKFAVKKYDFANALFCPNKVEKFGTNTLITLVRQDRISAVKDVLVDFVETEVAVQNRFKEVSGGISVNPAPAIDLTAHYRKALPNVGNVPIQVDGNQIEVMHGTRQVMAPLGVDIKNWGMSLFGGYNFSDGNDGPDRPAIRTQLQRMFAANFLQEDPQLVKLLQDYEYEDHYRLANPNRNLSDMFTTPGWTRINAEICSTIAERLK